MVYPASAILTMGYSWSLCMAQRIKEAQIETIPSFGQSHLVSDAHGRLVFHEHDTGGCSGRNTSHFVYVVNLGVLSLDAATTSQVFG